MRNEYRPVIFVDLDGVLADFDNGYRKYFKDEPPNKGGASNDVMWERIHATPNFFFGLDHIQETVGLINSLRSDYGSVAKIMILTAASKNHFAVMAPQKMAWVRKHYGSDITVIPTYGSSSKQFYIQNPGDILIDDYRRNCIRWADAGGEAVHYQGNVNDVKQAIDEIFCERHPAT